MKVQALKGLYIKAFFYRIAFIQVFLLAISLLAKADNKNSISFIFFSMFFSFLIAFSTSWFIDIDKNTKEFFKSFLVFALFSLFIPILDLLSEKAELTKVLFSLLIPIMFSLGFEVGLESIDWYHSFLFFFIIMTHALLSYIVSSLLFSPLFVLSFIVTYIINKIAHILLSISSKRPLNVLILILMIVITIVK